MTDRVREASLETAVGAAVPYISARDREMFDRSPIGVVISDLDRRIHYANREAMTLLGVDAYEGRSLHDAFIDEDARAVLDEQLGLRREGLIGGYRTTLRRLSDNKAISVAVTGIPLTDPEGRVVGTLGYFRSLATESLIEDVHRLNGETEDGHKLMLAVADLLAGSFRADMVIVARYSDNLRHANPFFVYRPANARGRIEWRKRWIALDEHQQDDVRNGTTRVVNGLGEYMRSGVWRSVTEDPFVRAILEDGQDSALSRPIRRRGVVIGTVTFLARQPGAFDDRDRSLLDELPVDATVLHVLDAAHQRQEHERFKMLRELTRAVTVKQACDVLARRLAEIFNWTHVSVFRVDYAEKHIHLLAQYSPPQKPPLKPLLLGEAYKQPLDKGLLGRVVTTRRLVNVGNVPDDPDYIGQDPENGVLSELCCPINFERDDTVRWIINVEDRNEDAFSENECIWLGEIAAEVGALMERISNLHFLTECFRNASDPIVVTGPNHDIRKANPAAASLLGYADPKDIQGSFGELFAESAALDRIGDREGDVGEFMVRRKNPDEYAVPVHLSRRQLPENLGGTIFVLKDLRGIRRMVELEFLSVVAYEVAAQTRAPLGMATTALERIREGLDPSSGRDLDKVLRLLNRVRQGYTRLALYNRESAPSAGGVVAVNLAAELNAVVADLPHTEAPLVHLVQGERSLVVMGDHFKIGLVLETLIAALARCAPDGEPVVVGVERNDGRALLVLTGYLPGPDAEDPVVARLGSYVRADVRISRPLIHRFMAEHDGTLSEQRDADGRVRFVLDFPLADAA